MEDRRIADYFVLAGLPDHNRVSLDDAASSYGSSSPPLSPNQTVIDPITDVSVIIRSQGEVVPKGWHCIESTPLQHPADLNHGSLRSPSVYIIFRRGKDKPPLVDVGILYEGKERVMADSEVVHTTPFGRQANVNNSGSKTFLTFRRAKDNAPCSQLVVTDICVIFTNKGETPPHAFCLVHKNLNKGMVGSDVYLCYKKSMNRPPLIRYQPSILGRYPYDNYDCYALPESVPMFCMPMGATIEKWPRNCQQPRPVFSTFVLTTDSAVKLYGAAVTFYETYPEENLTEEEAFLLETKSSNLTAYSLHAVKSICILSRWSFFDTFERFLIFLYKTQSCSVNNPTTLPIERYISHFMVEVPFPTVQRPKILVQLTATSDETVLLSQPPEDMPLPLSGASFTQLLRNLGPDNCLNVLLLTLLEQKILLHSLRQDVLTGVAEALTSIIFPFHWQCPYIPLCPLNLSDVLNAPLPFIVGVDSRYFDFHEPPLDVICVDLDTNSIYLSENKRSLNVKSLPKRATRVLKNSLDELFEKLLRPSQPANGTYNAQSQVKSRILSPFSTDTIAAKKLEHQIDLEIREAFLRFMASILRNFRSYLLPITRAPTVGATDPGSLFDLAGFLRSRDKNYHRFYQLLMTTQMFTRFIEERSFVSDKDTCLAFFDQCLDKVEMVSESDAVVNMRLLDADDYLKNDRTVFIPAPEAEDERTFKYHSFGPLNEGLFHLHPDTSARKISADETGRSCSTSQLNFTVTTGSPLSRRTKQEVRVALKNARRHSEAPLTWAKCLVSYCYSLWFIHLPAYAKSTSSQSTSNNTPLKIAIEVLQRMETVNLHPMDEVCYRVLMLLCGEYGQPALAVKVLFEMKEHGVVPNAITYGYYNKAVLESKWPTGGTTATILWSRLRNVLSGVVEFKRRGRQRSSSIDSKAKSDKAEDKPTDECDAENFMTEKSKLENAGLNFGASNAFRKRAGSIIKASPSTFGVEINAKSSAGLLMTTSLDTTKRDTFNLPLKSVHSQIHGTVTSTKSMSPTVELPPMKQYSRSFSFGNDSKILNKLQEGSLKALKQEIERSHHQVVEEVAEENFLKEFDGDVPDSHNVPSNLLIELENGDSGVSVNSEQLRYNVTSTPNSKSNKESNGKPVNHENGEVRHPSNSEIFTPESKFASTLRSSFRLASRLTTAQPKSTNSMSRSLTFNDSADKLGMKISSFFKSKPLKKDAVSFAPGQTRSPLNRSATLPPTMEGRDLVDTNLVIDDLSQKADSDTGSHTGATPSQESLPDVSDANGSPWTSRLGTIKYTDLVKSAATTMASRLNEFKSTLASNTNSPAKSANTSVMSGTAAFISQWANMVAEKIPSQFSLEDEDWGSSNSLDGRRLSMAPSDEDSSEWSREANSARAASFSQNIPHSMFDDVEKHYASSLEHNRDSPKFVEIVMCSSCRCYTCSAVLFDEEIMEGWTADDSNLNTSCPHCNFSFVPLLSICFKNVSENEPLVSLEDSKNHTKRTDSEPFTVPYLSPLVLRKELETVMLNEGDLSLLNPAFVDDHPIIYWNVLWYFKRINVPSHLPGLILRSNNHKGYFGHLAETGSVDYRNVAVSCLWDNHKLHEDMRKPMYRIYTESNLQSPLLHALATEDKTVPMGLIKQIIKSVQCNDLTTPMNLLTNERLRATENKPNVQRYSYSVYRDLLFLTIVAIGRENIDEVSFDREYRRAFESISPNQQLSMSAVDKPPSVGAIFCRRFFKELELNPVY